MRDAALERLDRAEALARGGREQEAIPLYREALELGLPSQLQARAQLGLGCSLREVRRHAEAIAVLEEACATYPDHAELRFFRALALRSGGREREAFEALGRLVLDEADLRGANRAALRALEHLD